MPDSPERAFRIQVGFGDRTNEGTDMAAVIRRSWPEADVRAVMDDAGAVVNYRVVIGFDDEEEWANALFRLRDGLNEIGCPFTVEGPDA